MVVYGVTPGPGAFPGVSSVFIYGQQVCDQFKHLHLADLPKVEPNAPLIFGAWHPQYSLPLRRHPGPRYCLWTSPLLQVELQDQEPAYLEMLLGMRQRGLIELIHLDMDSQGILPGLHVPAPFVCPKSETSFADREGAAFLSPAHPRKNVLTQALGAKVAGLRLHLNGFGPYTALLRAMEVPFVDHGWFPSREAYLGALSRCKVSMGVTLSESFGYSFAESLAVETPVVASPVVAHNMGLVGWPTCYDIDNPSAVAAAIRTILSDWEGWSAKGRAAIEKTAAANSEGFRTVIRGLEAR